MHTSRHLAKLARAGHDGHTWYHDASIEITAAAKILNVEPKYLASLLAIFSPKTSVTRSIRHAIRYAKTGEFNQDVMRGTCAAIATFEKTGKINGLKTEPFSRAILGDPDAVVLDVWMSRAMDIEQKHFKNKAIYAEASLLICRAGKQVGLTPAETQAAIWTATVRAAGRNPTKLGILRELQGE